MTEISYCHIESDDGICVIISGNSMSPSFHREDNGECLLLVDDLEILLPESHAYTVQDNTGVFYINNECNTYAPNM